MLITTRDIEILMLLGNVGILDTLTIHKRVFPNDTTGRSCQRRLKLLTTEGFISSVDLIGPLAGGQFGRLPRIHALTSVGADVVDHHTGCRPPRILRSDPKPMTLLHRLTVVHCRLAIDESAASLGMEAPAWILEGDVKAESTGQGKSPSNRLMLYETFAVRGQQISCQPDAASYLKIPLGGKTTNLLAYWEIDRSTESHRQFLRKLPGYTQLISLERFRAHWPDVADPTLRILCVCQSRQRIENLSETLRLSPIAKLFRFALQQDLTADRVLQAPVWQTIDGECRAMVPPRV